MMEVVTAFLASLFGISLFFIWKHHRFIKKSERLRAELDTEFKKLMRGEENTYDSVLDELDNHWRRL